MPMQIARFAHTTMTDSHDYREPWELKDASDPSVKGGSLWKSTRVRILAALTLVLALVGVSIDTKRSRYEDDIVTVYTIADALQRQPALSDIPMTDTLFTVRTLVAGARTGARGFVKLDDLGDIEQVAAASLAGQKNVMKKMFPDMNGAGSTGPDSKLMTSQITKAVSRFYGRERVSAELVAELLRHQGMNLKQVRAFLTQEMFSSTEDVYKYQMAILNEELRVRQEMHRFPFGWLSGRIRGTYLYMEDQRLKAASTQRLPAAQPEYSSPAKPKQTADLRTPAENHDQVVQKPAWAKVESSRSMTSYIDPQSITPQNNNRVRYVLLSNAHEPISPVVSSIMTLEIDCKTRHYSVLSLKNFSREFCKGDLISEMSAEMIERVAGVYFPSDESLLLHTKVVCKHGQAPA